MLSLVISADRLYQVVTSPTIDNEEKLKAINELKTHVKKDFVDIKQVPKYVEALSIAVDISDTGVMFSSFSVLSHLVKRVSMQDASGEVLKSQGYLLLPVIINKLGDMKTSTRSSSKKALEAYWFSAPKEVEESIIDIAFYHKNVKVISESLNWLDHIITNVNPHFKLNHFLPHIVKLLRVHLDDDREGLLENIKKLVKDYYSLKHNRLYKFDLAKEMDAQKIPKELCDSIINEIGTNAPYFVRQATPDSKLEQLKTEHNFVLAGNTRITVNLANGDKRSTTLTPVTSSTLSRPKSRTNFHNYTKSILPSLDDEYGAKLLIQNSASKINSSTINTSSKPSAVKNEPVIDASIGIINPEIEKIIEKSFTYKIDPSILPVDVKDVEDFYLTMNNLFNAFEGKETEFNWNIREKNIVKLRSIIRGNASRMFMHEIVTSLREHSESICKAVNSLRTTLCSHSCHLLKESAIILQERFDPLVDAYVPQLMKLCSATKHIASSNANMALCAIFINVPFNYKLLNKILISANDKNVQPRSYSGMWLQIMLVRFNNNSAFTYHGPSSNSGIDTSIKILTKLLSDANPNVRQIAKDTYWCFWNKFPSDAEAMLMRLDSNVVKAIERSKPKNISSKDQLPTLSSLTSKKQRPSIKDSIIARNRELRNKLKDHSRSVSRNNMTPPPQIVEGDNQKSEKLINSGFDSGRFSKLGTAKRTLSTSSLSKIDMKQDPLVRKVSDSSTINKRASEIEKHNASQNKDMKSNTIHTDNVSAHQDFIKSQTHDIDSFDKQSDPILKFLSSNQKDLITEGINLLKYAIMGEEDLSTEIVSLLKRLSVRNQDMLKPLFLTNENLFKRSYQFFTPEDFFRVCCILIHPMDEKVVDMIISIAEVDDIYSSAIKLISYTTNLGNIIDDSDMTMQIIRFKSILIRLIIEFLNSGLDKIPISDSHFLKLVTNLFELVGLVKSTGLYKSFCDLLAKLYSINPTLFTSELQMITTSTRDEVEYVVGIDGILDLTQSNHANNFNTLYDLTRVMPGNNLGNMSPLKGPSDLTMVVPVETDAINEIENPNETPDNMGEITKMIDNAEGNVFETDQAKSLEPREDIISHKATIEIDQSDDPMEVDGNQSDKDSQIKFGLHDSKSQVILDVEGVHSNDDIDNVFVDIGSDASLKRPDIFSKLQQETSTELAENFAQVQINELSNKGEHNKNPIKSFIDKVDPLNKVSLKNKPINIYEDGNCKGSPQKVKDYSYTELNWFNFQLAKLALDDIDYEDADYCVEDFKILCHKLSIRSIEGKEFVSLLNYLQSVQMSNINFSNYFQSLGHSLIEESLWEFFENTSILNLPNKLSGLILLKQLLINRLRVNLERLWCLLIDLSSEPKSSTEEISLAISETFDEMLTGLFSSEIIFSRILLELESVNTDESNYTLTFILDCLSKVLSMNTISLLIDEELIVRIDAILSKFMNNNEVEIRRHVILSYGKILKASRVSDAIEFNDTEHTKDSVMGNIMDRLTIPQKKLIEYYSQA